MHQIANHNKTSTCPFRLSVSPSHARPLFSHCFLLTEWLYHPFLKQNTRSVPVPLWVQQSWGRGTMCRRRESSRWARGWRILWMFNIAIHRSLHHGMKWPRTPVLICEWKKKKRCTMSEEYEKGRDWSLRENRLGTFSHSCFVKNATSL